MFQGRGARIQRSAFLSWNLLHHGIQLEMGSACVEVQAIQERLAVTLAAHVRSARLSEGWPLAPASSASADLAIRGREILLQKKIASVLNMYSCLSCHHPLNNTV